jgi:hypothetical protein
VKKEIAVRNKLGRYVIRNTQCVIHTVFFNSFFTKIQEPGLNDLQRVAYNSITHALATSLHTANDVIPDGPIPPNLFFVYSPGGCGKTHLNTLLLNRVRSQGHIALAMASSRIAALLMDGGSTFHSRCKPPKQPYFLACSPFVVSRGAASEFRPEPFLKSHKSFELGAG